MVQHIIAMQRSESFHHASISWNVKLRIIPTCRAGYVLAVKGVYFRSHEQIDKSTDSLIYLGINEGSRGTYC